MCLGQPKTIDNTMINLGVLFGSYASTGILVDIAMWRANKTLLNHVSLEGSSFIVPWRGVRRDDSI